MHHSYATIAAGILLPLYLSTALAQPTTINRTLEGNGTSLASSAASNSRIARTLDSLRAGAAATGKARVIVGIRTAFAPEGVLSTATAREQRNDIAATQGTVLEKVPSIKGPGKKLKQFQNIPFLAMEVDAAELESLAALPEVTSIEEDKLAAPYLAESVALIGGTTAWTSGYTGTGQTVAILDTGVDKTHPFLAGKVVAEACFSSTDSGQGSTSVCPGGVAQSTASGSAVNCPTNIDGCNHGTHVAGIVAGKGASFSGVAPDANIIAVQVFSRFDNISYCGSSTPCALTYTSDQVLGLERVYALRNTYNISAVNMSLGGGRYFDQASCDASNASIKYAIDNLRSVNIATIVASGNDGYTNSMGGPGCISSAISVGATYDAAGYNNSCLSNNLGASSTNQIACYSNSASFLSLLAPGSVINSSVPGGAYSNYSGTSMATPHVAGAWALMKQKNPTLSVSAGLSALTSTGLLVTDPRNGIVKPRIQVSAALSSVSSNCTYSFSPSSALTSSGTSAGSFSVSTNYGCPWGATSNANWITSSSTGTGNGTVTYSVAANSGSASRVGTINIGLQAFTITQAGSPVETGTNVALASNGAVATASSTMGSIYPVSSIIDNELTGKNFGSGGAWEDNTIEAWPDWVQIDFNGAQTIDRVVLFSLQDNYSNGVAPTDTTQFTRFGITGFNVQAWNGSAWVTLSTITGNNLVKRTVTFAPVTTAKIRINVSSALAYYSRIVEVQAWSTLN